MCEWQCAAIAQLVERIHGKDEVSGSTPDRGSILQVSLKNADQYATLITVLLHCYAALAQLVRATVL